MDTGRANIATIGVQSDEQSAAWTVGTRLSFRFAFCYLSLCCLDLLADTFAFVQYTWARDSDPQPFTAIVWHHFVPWIGQHLLRLHTPITIFSNSSGDTTYDWVLVLTELMLAAIITVAWTALDRKRRDYSTLYAWLRTVVRVALGGEMLAYGIDKAIPLQFGAISLVDMSKPVGELTPMGMLWTFMAASPGYTIFTGVVETLGGMLLLFPELTVLGAILSGAAMANVLALDLGYDVPVKLRSFHLLLLSVFLLLPQIPGLLNVLLWNRRTAPVVEVPLSSQCWLAALMRWGPPGLGLLLVAGLGLSTWRTYAERRAAMAVRHEDYGIWQTQSFEVKDETKPLVTEKIAAGLKLAPGEDRWEQVILESQDTAWLRMGNGEYGYVRLQSGVAPGSTIMTAPFDPAWRCVLSFKMSTPGTLLITGTVNGSEIKATFKRIDGPNYRLINPGIHWISEHAE